jgi:Ca2+:H+ antiporter
VHHAEVVAHRVGEPYGTLVLAVAVTVIEVALILSIMLAGGPQKATLPRDTIFAAVMIICNGVVGVCLLVGGWHHREQSFRIEGTNSGLAALVALATLSLVLPTFTVSSAEGTYTRSQLFFVAVVSIAMWAIFVFVQTVRHRDYFLPVAMPRRLRRRAAGPASGCCWCRWWAWSAWPSCCHRASSAWSWNCMRRQPWSA